jgi:hypothetical protein
MIKGRRLSRAVRNKIPTGVDHAQDRLNHLLGFFPWAKQVDLNVHCGTSGGAFEAAQQAKRWDVADLHCVPMGAAVVALQPSDVIPVLTTKVITITHSNTPENLRETRKRGN